MGLREVGFFVRGRLNHTLSRALNRRRPAAAVTPLALETVLAMADPAPLDIARAFEGRSNAAREALVARYLDARGIAFETHRFKSFEGAGENYAVDVGRGDRILVLIAHHDAVPGSPGANDNAASLGILLRLLRRLAADPPSRLRVRFLFTAAEELGYLGARAVVRDRDVAGIAGVVSLELCGIGDSVALWDAGSESPLLRAYRSAADDLGWRPDEGYHVVGRIPVFGSDHRAFTHEGIPGYGLTVIPVAEAEALRRFVLTPWRGVLQQVTRRPPPFATYHTANDRCDTLDPAALDRTAVLLEGLVRTF
jgi:hypothetical protein